jgi:hypothetical protein
LEQHFMNFSQINMRHSTNIKTVRQPAFPTRAFDVKNCH